jgi:hypothetical protein
MYKVKEGQKIKNITVNGKGKNFYGGDILPDDYIIPESYLKNGIVEEVEKKGRVK